MNPNGRLNNEYCWGSMVRVLTDACDYAVEQALILKNVRAELKTTQIALKKAENELAKTKVCIQRKRNRAGNLGKSPKNAVQADMIASAIDRAFWGDS